MSQPCLDTGLSWKHPRQNTDSPTGTPAKRQLGTAISSFKRLSCLRLRSRDQAGKGDHCAETDGRSGKRTDLKTARFKSQRCTLQLGGLRQVHSVFCASLFFWSDIVYFIVTLKEFSSWHTVYGGFNIFNCVLRFIYYHSCFWRAHKFSVSKTLPSRSGFLISQSY